ncbi:ABC transporter ATP-binding protein [Candidatus Sumerlaeota bacterium]|nr:ABC transporter ATP-binding protein [Candidatus Sumerlaeota bacterium]
MSTEPVIEIKDLRVEYKRGLGLKPLVAVDGLNLRVERGEVVGFIGPNGAGKSTTIKALLGFIFPKRGSVKVLGLPAGHTSAKRRIGYLPEVAVYYPFMKAKELLTIYGGLAGLRGEELERRVDEVLTMVGLKGRENELLKKYSKGMLQRLGIAQAFLGDPEVLILDEVTSGLDPVGRRDLRQILLNYKKQGKTVFFSSHELSEVSLMCDRVIIIDQGRVVEEKKISDLMLELQSFEVVVRSPTPVVLDGTYKIEKSGDNLYRISLTQKQKPLDVLTELIHKNYEVIEFGSPALSLEEYFVKVVGKKIS